MVIIGLRWCSFRIKLNSYVSSKSQEDIISIEKDHIKVKSEKTKKIRKIPRLQFERVWNSLVAKGFYISKNHQPYVHSQIICAILSLLNYVEARQNQRKRF